MSLIKYASEEFVSNKIDEKLEELQDDSNSNESILKSDFEYGNLKTEDKTIIGAINELHSMFGSYVDEVAQLIGGDA